ncbi:glutathione peroxidase [Pedobacter sp. MC2016-14]|uniref:glutathione peroxidase n=1 Tax=Pedobacter sp. MC2016-14 TaxID=2897327 RepID=UPI001E46965D|nr:glutathione peroxidase [Pedobacter sp. MC2016-14]MCD0489074.1 glutathione peroxidase [Pedobacter sp. MC2016-14]
MTDHPNSIHQFKVKLINGTEKKLSDYKGKVILIVNTATGCGFAPQLKELETLKNLFKDQDFEVLAFPSNDFGRQEPLNGVDIEEYCAVNHGVSFPMFDKVMVRGSEAHPLYHFLTKISTPRWNFHKYLVNKEGEVEDYFFPFTKPLSSKIKKKIQKLL